MRGIGRMALLALTMAPALAAAQDAPPAEDEGEVVIRSDLPRCRAQPDDPAERADYSRASNLQQVFRLDPKTGAAWVAPDDNPPLGPDIWQRAGTHLGDYVYRAPKDGTPLCIGGFAKHPRGWGQLRQILDAEPLHGKYVRFTAFVATRRSDEVRFWLAAGDSFRIYQGGDTNGQPLWGTHGTWIPVMLTIGPITGSATKVSYGFLLMGSGTVWVNAPKIEVLDHVDADGAPRLSKDFVTRPSRH